ITHDRRGDEVTSPDGVKSVLAARRLVDMNKDGHPAWRFISVKHWDEYPRGTWTIRVSDTNAKDRTGRSSVRRLTCPSHASTEYPIRQNSALSPKSQ
ncbi:hypothetical protein EDB85DRAFT_1868765, partial [Lactarius pseudohatsudake]